MELFSTIILSGLSLVLLWMWSVKNYRQHHLPPGPRPFPVIGNLLQIDRKAPFKTFLKLSERYGPVLTVYLARKRVVVLLGYNCIKEALVDQADDFTDRGPFPLLLKATRGYGLSISNGERWRQLRRFTMMTLRDFGMGRKRMEEWIQDESRHLAAGIDNMKEKAFDPTFFLRRTMSNVICCLVFGQRFKYDDDHFPSILRIISDTLMFDSSPMGQLYNVFPGLMEWLPGHHHTVFGNVGKLREFIMKNIEEHQQSLDLSSPRDYIDCFLIRLHQEKDNPTTEFHYDNLVSTVLNLFRAGTETISTTLRFSLNILIKYPKIQEQMQEEIYSVIGRERCPNMEDKKSLPFTYAVIHEIQRLMDVVPMSIPHYALKDISFRGYTIPNGTVILPLLHSVLREEKHWATPWSFNPDHFLDQTGKFKKNLAFLPFSAGKRACVGESLARMEHFIFLVSLMQHFSFSCPGGPESIDLTSEYSSFANLPHSYQIVAAPGEHSGHCRS